MVTLAAWLMSLALTADADPNDGETSRPHNDVPSVGQVVQINGQANVVHSHDAEDVVPLEHAGMVHATDKISTQSSSWVRLLLEDGSVVDLAPDSAVSIEVYRRTSDTQVAIRLRALNGRLWAHIKPRDEGGDPDFAIVTAQAVANVRGTSFIVDTVESDVTVITAATGHVSLYPGYLLGDASPTEVFGRQSAVIEGTAWPPEVSPVSVDTLRALRDALTPRPALDSAGQAERMHRLEDRQKGGGAVVAKAGLPLQFLPSTQPTTVAPPLSLDPGARNAQVSVSVHIND